MSEKKELMSCSKDEETRCVYSQSYATCVNDKCHIKQQQMQLEEEYEKELF